MQDSGVALGGHQSNHVIPTSCLELDLWNQTVKSATRNQIATAVSTMSWSRGSRSMRFSNKPADWWQKSVCVARKNALARTALHRTLGKKVLSRAEMNFLLEFTWHDSIVCCYTYVVPPMPLCAISDPEYSRSTTTPRHPLPLQNRISRLLQGRVAQWSNGSRVSVACEMLPLG